MAVQNRLDMDLMAETELIRLQRQYRIMEGDRQAFYSEIKNKLTKQRKEIKILEMERNELLENYKIATCNNQRKKDMKNQQIIEELLENFDKMSNKIHKTKQDLYELEQQIKKIEKELHQLRLKQMPDNEYEERVKSSRRLIEILENRLDTTIKKFCKILTNNRKLREEIDHLLIERQQYNNIWQKLIDQYDNNKKFILDLIEQAIQAYEQRDEWCSKLQALKIRAHNDTIIHTQEMREMQRQLDHYGNLKDFLIIKGQKRINRDLELKEQQRKETEQDRLIKQQELLKETIEKIQRICNEMDVKRIVGKYLKQDEENFALFTYVNELNHELENLKITINQLDDKINEQNELKQNDNKTNDEILKQLELELMEITRKTNDEIRREDELDGEFQLILKEIGEIFELLKCDCTPVLELLGDSKIDEKNVLIYLNLVHKKISTLFCDEYFKEDMMLKSKSGKK